MVRLGELLVAAGLLTAEQIEQALRAQVMWGGRLGTNLIELGFLDLDTLSQQLGRQLRMPAALARHFDKADREVQLKLPADVAERYSAVPLMRIGPQKLVVLASIAPIDKRGLEIIAGELEVDPLLVLASVAAELRIRYHLERVYKIPRGSRFLRSRGKTIPPFPQFEINPETTEDSEVDIQPLPADTSELPIVVPPPEPSPEPSIDDLSSLAILEHEPAIAARPDTIEDEPSGRERRKYVRTITDEPSNDSERTLARIAIRRVAISGAAAGVTLGEATRAIRRSTDRDRVAELVMSALDRFMTACEAAILLVVRGDVAIGWKGLSRSRAALPEIAVPLEQPGLLPKALLRAATVRLPASELSSVDQLLVSSLGGSAGDLVIVPVTIGDQVMCLIALVVPGDMPASSAESIAAAAGAAFARLMRDASR
jgi:hypothetical protein